MTSLAVDTRPTRARLYGLLGLMTFIWALNYVVAKFALREFPGLLLVGLRTLGAGLVMIPIYHWWAEPEERRSWTWRNAPLLLGLGLFGVILNQLLYVLGMARTSVGHASIINATTPLLTLALAAMLGQERLTSRKLAGLAVAIAGVAVLQLAPVPSGHGASGLGDLLMVFNTLTFAIYSVSGKNVTRRFGSLTVNAFAYVGGALLLLPMTWGLSKGFDYSHVSARAWAALAYMSVLPSVVGYLIYYYALAYLPASRLSSFTYVQPFLATLLAIPFLGETVSLPLLCGGLLALTGLFLSGRTS